MCSALWRCMKSGAILWEYGHIQVAVLRLRVAKIDRRFAGLAGARFLVLSFGAASLFCSAGAIVWTGIPLKLTKELGR